MKLPVVLLAIILLPACQPPMSEQIIAPRTQNAETFAKVFLDQIQERSFAADREFCGLFGRDSRGYVRATAPVMGYRDSCTPTFEPEDFNVFAVYHSHGAFSPEVDSEVPSSYDLVADREEHVVGFISTPGGRLWRSENGRAVLLCDAGCITVDPDFVPGLHGPIASRYTADELHRREAGN